MTEPWPFGGTLCPEGHLSGDFPVMIVLEPLVALRYLYWRHCCGPERTTRQYLQAEPR